jgi:hypothetical protein
MKLRFLVPLAAVLVVAILALASCGGGGGSDASASTFCPSYAAFQKAGSAFDNITSDDVQAGKDAIASATTKLDQLADDSPSEVKGDVEDVRDWFQGASDAIADADTTADVQTAGQKYTKDNPQREDAYSAVDKYASDNCDGDKAKS